MDKAIRDQWTKALRSGEYEQGHNLLCNDGKYCCLGVLADVLGELDDRGWVRHNSEPYASQLPPELLKRCGLDAYDQGVLIELNDNDEASFTEIADYIEENL